MFKIFAAMTMTTMVQMVHGDDVPTVAKRIATFDETVTTYKWNVVNDGVMGGKSKGLFSLNEPQHTGMFNGTVAMVPGLMVPGFSKMTTVEGSGPAMPDLSAYLGGGFVLRVRTSAAHATYKGYKLGFKAPGIPPRPFRGGSFKAPFNLNGVIWQDVVVPFSSFSYDWSSFTGDCFTKDPDGTQHYCCSAAHPEVCPTEKSLAAITELQLWAEGVQGDFKLIIDYIGVYGGPTPIDVALIPHQVHFNPTMTKFVPPEEDIVLLNPTHYGPPSGGCWSDELDVQVQGLKGAFCAPECKSGGTPQSPSCPVDLPQGADSVTVNPRCAIMTPKGQKYCALMCRTGVANKCGKGATCQPVAQMKGFGLCTYDSTAETI